MATCINNARLFIFGLIIDNWEMTTEAKTETVQMRGWAREMMVGEYEYSLSLHSLSKKRISKIEKAINKSFKKDEVIKFSFKKKGEPRFSYEMTFRDCETGKPDGLLRSFNLTGRAYFKPLVYVNRWKEGYLFTHKEPLYNYDYDGNQYKEGMRDVIYFLSEKPCECLHEEDQPSYIIREWSYEAFVEEYAGGIPQETKGWENPEYCEILLSVVKEKK